MKFKKIICLMLAFTFIFGFTNVASAGTFYDTDVNTGQSWSYVNSTTYYWSAGTYLREKEVTYNYKGSSYNYTSWKTVSDNYYHTQGYADLTATNNITTTHTVCTSASSTIAGGFGASLGYQYSYSSSMSVSSTITPTLSSGYYHFAVKFRLRDFKVRQNVYLQEYQSGSWVTIYTHPTDYYYGSRVDYTGSGSTPLYYNWVAS